MQICILLFDYLHLIIHNIYAALDHTTSRDKTMPESRQEKKQRKKNEKEPLYGKGMFDHKTELKNSVPDSIFEDATANHSDSEAKSNKSGGGCRIM